MKTDYRKQVIPIEEIENKEMLGKIVVIKTRIYFAAFVSPKLNIVLGRDTSFPLFPNDPAHVAIGDELDNVYSENSGSKKGDVYLRGQVFVNNYGLHFLKKWYCEYVFPYNTIRPVRGIPFIVGDEEESF